MRRSPLRFLLLPLGAVLSLLGLYQILWKSEVVFGLIGLAAGTAMLALCLWDAPPAPDEPLTFGALTPWSRVLIVLSVGVVLLIGWLGSQGVITDWAAITVCGGLFVIWILVITWQVAHAESSPFFSVLARGLGARSPDTRAMRRARSAPERLAALRQPYGPPGASSSRTRPRMTASQSSPERRR